MSTAAGRSEQDPQCWYDAVCSMLQSLSVKDPGLLKKITAVGVTGQMRGLTLIGGDGRVVRDSILWNDLRCDGEVAAIAGRERTRIEEITKNPLNTMCSLPKIIQLMTEEPSTWEKTEKLIFPKDYIAYRLTGSIQTDHSDASGSSLYDMGAGRWSDEILDRYGIDRAKLPDIVSSTAVIGTVTPVAEKETGIPAGVPVTAGGSDAVTELFSAGVTDASGCKIRLGTSGALSTAVDDLNAAGRGSYLWAYVVPGRYMVDINTRSCAQSTVWLRDVLFGGKGTEDAFGLMEREASGVPAGAEGLVFHPYLMGEDAPYWDPKLKGSFWGITASHTRGHFARAVYEGTAFALADAMACLGEIGRGFSDYVVVGGGAKNALWTTIVLDVLGVDARIPVHAGSAMGAVLLAGVGAGVFADIGCAAQVCGSDGAVRRHSPENHAAYRGIFRRYRAMKGIFDEIYQV